MNGKKEIKAGLGYTIGNILIKGITFITLPIFSRILTTSQYGIYNTYMAYESILAIFLGLGMYSSIKNSKIDFPDKINQYTSTLLWITLFPLIFFILIILLFPEKLEQIFGFSQVLLIILVLQSYGSAMLSISNSRLSVDYNYKKYMAFACFNTIMNIGFSIILILTIFNDKREYGRILGSAIPLIFIGIFIFFTNQKAGLFSFDRDMAKYALLIGFPLIWHYLSQQVQNQFDRIAITRIAGPSFTGIYSFTYNIANILNVIFNSAENVWTVWFFDQMSQKNYKLIREISKKFMLFIAMIAIIMMVGSKEIIMIMGEKSYWEGQYLFIPLLLSVFLLFLYSLPVGIEYYYKKTKYIPLMTCIAAIINVTLNFALIPYYGYFAAAYATLLSHAVQFLGHWFLSKKILQNNGISKVFEFIDFIKSFILVCICGIIVSILNPYPVIKYSIFTVFFSFEAYKYRNELENIINMFIS